MAEDQKKTNNCLVLRGYGSYNKLQVQEKPMPTPAKDQIRIKVEACGINFAEMMACQGLYGINPSPPCVLGFEVGGVVDELGEGVTEPAVGTRVIGICRYGGWSSYIISPEDLVWAIPESMSFEEAAAIPVNYLTTYIMLFSFGNLHSGQSVLCHMASGGVGCAVGQLCKTVPDVTLYGTCSAAKHEAAKENGYTHLVDYRTQDYVQEIRKVEPEGIDLVLDPLGGAENKRNYELTKTFGRQIIYGSANVITGETRSLLRLAKTWWNTSGTNPMDLMAGNKMVGGVHLGYLFDGFYKRILPEAMAKVIEWYNQGIVKPKIDSVHAFENFADAFRRMHERKNIGKIILTPRKTEKPE